MGAWEDKNIFLHTTLIKRYSLQVTEVLDVLSFTWVNGSRGINPTESTVSLIRTHQLKNIIWRDKCRPYCWTRTRRRNKSHGADRFYPHPNDCLRLAASIRGIRVIRYIQRRFWKSWSWKESQFPAVGLTQRLLNNGRVLSKYKLAYLVITHLLAPTRGVGLDDCRLSY